MQQNIIRVKPAYPMPAIVLASITGSALLKPLLRSCQRSKTSILCAVSNHSDLDAMFELHLVYIAASNAKHFISELGIPYRHAVAVNSKGNPLTSQQIARLI